MKLLKLILLLFTGLQSVAQTDSCGLRISLITCGPGQELYSIFGHSAIRVTEPASRTDIIYNYGTFDFEDPNFYAKFTKGSLLYFVSTEKYSDFLYQYEYENRSVTEQVLQLSCGEKHRLFSALKTNALEQNKYYHYDFILDNCSSRLRDIISQNTSERITFNDYLPEPTPSYRDLLHVYLEKGKQPWSKFGIDLLLGSVTDEEVTRSNAMFLPDYLMLAFDSASKSGLPLVASKTTIFEGLNSDQLEAPLVTPLLLFSVIAVVVIVLSFSRRNAVKRFLSVFDVAFFIALGVAGAAVAFMWFISDHELSANNYNLLWALPTHLPVAFVMMLQRNWLRKYFLVCTVIYLLLVVFWLLLPQGMNPAFFPVVVTAGVRSYFRTKY